MRKKSKGSGSGVVAHFLFLLGVLLSSGCALHGTTLPPPPDGRGSVLIGEVPFYAQEEYLCGPAALAMTLSWSGLPTRPEALVESVYTPGEKGSFQTEIITAARRRGRVAYVVHGADALVAELSAGNPVIVLQNLGLSWYPTWHYAVVIGYDHVAGEVILHSGVNKRKRVPTRVFLNTWGRSKFWGLLVLPPNRMPATVEEQHWLKAAVGLERARAFTEARTAYETATRRWPESYDAWMGLGNTDYALGDKPGAIKSFRRATTIRPDNGIAFNNLAQVLSETGRRGEALAAAQKAVASGGPHVDVFRRTLSEIEGVAPSP